MDKKQGEEADPRAVRARPGANILGIAAPDFKGPRRAARRLQAATGCTRFFGHVQGGFSNEHS